MANTQNKIIFIDMDGVLVDLKQEIDIWFIQNPDQYEKYQEHPDKIKDIFKNPKPIGGAIDAVKELAKSKKYDLFIATSATWGNPESAMHKRNWIETYFGDLFKKKMFITHRKDLLIGDYLIDDRLANGASKFKGELLSFGWAYEKNNGKGEWNEYKTWNDILKELL